jgi:2-oxoglutarate ferredoxin oxidoreductase subunit beta
VLTAGATFVARVFADVQQIKDVLEAAHQHKGFAFIEVIQPCIIFHKDLGFKERTYNLQNEAHDSSNLQDALKKADEFDYQNQEAKIPLGIFYQTQKPVFEDLIREK